MNPESWLSFFEALSIGAGVLAVAALIGTVVMGKKVNARQAEKLLTLEREAADAKNATVQLWKDVAPREIPDQSGMIAALKPFAGTSYALISLADVETSLAAEQIYLSVDVAQWKEVKVEKTLDDSRFREGIWVQWRGADERLRMAAQELAAQLNRNNVSATAAPYTRGDEEAFDLPPNVVLIKVGFKPFPRPPGEPEAAPLGAQQSRIRGARKRFPAPAK